MESGGGVKPEGLCRAPHLVAGGGAVLWGERSGWHQALEGPGRTLSHPLRSGVAT